MDWMTASASHATDGEIFVALEKKCWVLDLRDPGESVARMGPTGKYFIERRGVQIEYHNFAAMMSAARRFQPDHERWQFAGQR